MCVDGSRITFAGGAALIDQETQSIIAFRDDANPQRRFLLDDSVDWHSKSHAWGSGSVTTDHGSGQWLVPDGFQWDRNAQRLTYGIGDSGLSLTVVRTGGDVLTERYEWRNECSCDVTITQLSVQTPFNDRYPDARTALTECVHAHVFAGGAWSWVLAEPMDGSGNRLGLTLREGAINAYSIQSRNYVTSSNVRGHIVLQVADHAINPDSFGGQPVIVLHPGESYELEWRIGLYPDEESFISATDMPARFSAFNALVGDSINVSTRLKVVRAAEGLRVDHTDEGVELTARKPGTYALTLGDGKREMRTEVLFRPPFEEVVNKRVRYILDHQISRERPGALSGAFVTTDVRTGAHVLDSTWADWMDGSERIGMAVLVQRALNEGILEPDLRPRAQRAADGWRDFAEATLIDRTGAVRRGWAQHRSQYGGRLYDVPWMVQFYTEHYRATGDEHDLDMIELLSDRAQEIGGEHFLAIEYAESNMSAAEALEAAGRIAKANELRENIVASADYFLSLGRDLPAHEVAYEQSMVAPLVSLLNGAYALTGDRTYLEAVRERLKWLLAFGGPQPDSRLHGIAIRHWDGFWFGALRAFGDTFPHYWSALTAQVLLRLPDALRDDRTNELAKTIMQANMANYNADGSATCAFLFPSNVDGFALHRSDPLANDQDWHLAICLRAIHEDGLALD